MHGLGNDFMVIDLVTQKCDLTPQRVRRWANRQTGVGFDQLLAVEPPSAPDIDFDYRIFNADGSTAEQCGNGARCIARFVHQQELSVRLDLELQTQGGRVRARISGRDVEVEFEPPSTVLSDVPFLAAGAVDEWPPAYRVETTSGLIEVTPVSVGNPHGVVFVDNLTRIEVDAVGAELSRHPCFPKGANIGFCEVVDQGYVRLRVHERGVGETLACGTGACAAVVAGVLHGKLNSSVKVSLPSGKGWVNWQGDGAPVKMLGAAILVYEGVLET